MLRDRRRQPDKRGQMKQIRPTSQRKKHLLTGVAGVVGLFLWVSPALSDPIRTLTPKCRCSCGPVGAKGSEVVNIVPQGGVSQENCKAQSGETCVLKDGTGARLDCGDGVVVYAFPVPQPPPLNGSILDNLLAEVGSLHRADLLPLPAPGSAGPEGLCRLSPDLTRLQVHVYNQGTTLSALSTVHLEFANNLEGVDVPTPELIRGGSAIVEVSIPLSCYDASNNCHFRIGVDFTNAVEESDEINNNAAGVCGPSFL